MKQEHSQAPAPHGAPAEVLPPPQAAGTGTGNAGDEDAAAGLRACEAELARVLKDQELVSYGIAHDLRAPLRAIDGFASMLEVRSGDSLDASGREHLSRIRAAAARMGALIDALQALSRASHDSLDITVVDASLLADWALVELGEANPGRVLDASVQPGILVRADERQLKEVFDRLLHNAWKFSAGCDPVRIEVDAAREGDAVRIRVRDHGSGFDPRHAGLVFEPFQRVHGPEDGGGHGLGLAIAQRIARRMSGRIGVESVPGQGSVFHVELPAAGEGSAQ